MQDVVDERIGVEIGLGSGLAHGDEDSRVQGVRQA
jgi:hypothetical protein